MKLVRVLFLLTICFWHLVGCHSAVVEGDVPDAVELPSDFKAEESACRDAWHALLDSFMFDLAVDSSGVLSVRRGVAEGRGGALGKHVAWVWRQLRVPAASIESPEIDAETDEKIFIAFMSVQQIGNVQSQCVDLLWLELAMAERLQHADQKFSNIRAAHETTIGDVSWIDAARWVIYQILVPEVTH